MKSILTSSTYKFIGESPFEVTNWDGAQTQKVLTAAIAKYPKIDVIVSDFGPVMVSSLNEFTKSGRSIPAMATSDGNILGCFYLDNVNKKGNEDMKLMTVATGNDHVRLAVQHAVARATGGKIPAATRFKSPVFEDSETGKPQGVQCNRKIADFTFLSAQMSGVEQQKLLK
jgi:ribose transport system substrate-binding protein